MENNKEIDKIMKILDMNYFHVCFEVNEDILFWKIFFKNLDSKEYYSNENKALLNSKENTIEDIKRLNDKFKIEKLYEKIKINLFDLFDFNARQSEFCKKLSFIITILNFINLFSLKNVEFSILCLITTISILIFDTTNNKRFDKLIESIEETEDVEEDILKKHIKTLGLSFVERLRK